jgi:hypothetical protein
VPFPQAAYISGDSLDIKGDIWIPLLEASLDQANGKVRNVNAYPVAS